MRRVSGSAALAQPLEQINCQHETKQQGTQR
jgi:hypothetical protein